jgi:hypothetical protein
MKTWLTLIAFAFFLLTVIHVNQYLIDVKAEIKQEEKRLPLATVNPLDVYRDMFEGNATYELGR